MPAPAATVAAMSATFLTNALFLGHLEDLELDLLKR
jgi:hypothetical protein